MSVSHFFYSSFLEVLSKRRWKETCRSYFSETDCSAIIVSNFPRALSVLHQTLRRKGLGLDSSELDSEESMQVSTDKYPLSEGMDLSVARQRYYVSAHTLLLSHRYTQTSMSAHTKHVEPSLAESHSCHRKLTADFFWSKTNDSICVCVFF